MKKIAHNFLDSKNTLTFTKKEENEQEELSNTSLEDDTIPDEDFLMNKKQRNKINSYPNVLLEHRGPNINLKIMHKRYSNQKEKEMFFEKIKRKKKQSYAKITSFTRIVITVIIVPLLMELKNLEKISFYRVIRQNYVKASLKITHAILE